MEFCYKTAQAWYTAGIGVFILKILIPLTIIVFASVDLSKAVISNDEKAIKSATKKILHRIIAGVCIFFIPTAIKIVFSMVSLVSEDMKNDYNVCINCLTDPYNNCDTSYEGNIFKK